MALRFWAPSLKANIVGLNQQGRFHFIIALHDIVLSGLVCSGGLQRCGAHSHTPCGWRDVPGDRRGSDLAWACWVSRELIWAFRVPVLQYPSVPLQATAPRTLAGFIVPAVFSLKEQWLTVQPERDSIMSQLQIPTLQP